MSERKRKAGKGWQRCLKGWKRLIIIGYIFIEILQFKNICRKIYFDAIFLNCDISMNIYIIIVNYGSFYTLIFILYYDIFTYKL